MEYSVLKNDDIYFVFTEITCTMLRLVSRWNMVVRPNMSAIPLVCRRPSKAADYIKQKDSELRILTAPPRIHSQSFYYPSHITRMRSITNRCRSPLNLNSHRSLSSYSLSSQSISPYSLSSQSLRYYTTDKRQNTSIKIAKNIENGINLFLDAFCYSCLIAGLLLFILPFGTGVICFIIKSAFSFGNDIYSCISTEISKIKNS